MKVLVHFIKSFTCERGAGNAAGVVLDANSLTTQQMLKVTQDLGFSESAFLQKSDRGENILRVFSAVGEVSAAVTPTIAAAYLLSRDRVYFETRMGVREVRREPDGLLLMKQPAVEFVSTNVEKIEIAKLLKISPSSFSDYPLEIASAGTPKLLIPVKSLDDLFAIKPDLCGIASCCEAIGARGFYPFTLETKNLTSDFHARQFNPQDRIAEDPVTGVAAAALAGYFLKHSIFTKSRIVGEQGYIIDKPGKIIIEIATEAIYVGGYAIEFGEQEMLI